MGLVRLVRVTVAGGAVTWGLAASQPSARKPREGHGCRKQALEGLDRSSNVTGRASAQASEGRVRCRGADVHSVALECIKAEAPGWKNKRTVLLWRNSLERWAFPVLADLPVADIDRAAVRRGIDQVWTTRPATAKKVLRRIGAVLRYAAAHGWRANDNVADARMLRHAGLPALPGGRRQPSLAWARLPAFMTALDRMPGLAPLALRLGVLTVLRSGEVRQARWSWLSFDGMRPDRARQV
jgi:hypothetical protein